MGVTFLLETDIGVCPHTVGDTDFKAWCRLIDAGSLDPRPAAELIALANALKLDLAPLLRTTAGYGNDELAELPVAMPAEEQQKIRALWAVAVAQAEASWQDIATFTAYLERWVAALDQFGRRFKYQTVPAIVETVSEAVDTLLLRTQTAHEHGATCVRMVVRY